MTFSVAIILGVLQGFTEFLPVSSSGHLVLAETFFHLNVTGPHMQGFDVLLHTGTLLALLLCYASTWKKIILSPFTRDRTHLFLLFLLIIATIPAGIAGILLEDWIAFTFRSTSSIAIGFLLTAGVLVISERFHTDRGIQSLTILRAFSIGIGQMCAIVPGLSRSGWSMAAGRAVGLSRKNALDFSFLMAVPVIAGATLITVKNMMTGEIVLPAFSITAIGVVASCISSVVAIVFLRGFVMRYSLAWFAPYLIALGLALLFFS